MVKIDKVVLKINVEKGLGVKSFEFARAMGAVQEKALALGVHCYLEDQRKEKPELEIESMKGYKPEALTELQDAGKKLVDTKFPYLAKLDAGRDLTFEDLVAIEPTPWQTKGATTASNEVTPAAFSAPAASSAPTASTVMSS